MRILISFAFVLFIVARSLAADAPNILWIVTDDQRVDSIAAFNQMRFGKSDSALGKVLSPNVDRLAKMGTTFINTFNQNPGCAPSRTLMMTGRYSHRTGVYGFEYYNPVGQKHWRPMVPEILRDQAGYQTLSVGKLGIRAQHFIGQKGGTEPPLYQTHLGYRKEFAAKGMVDWHSERKWSKGKPGPKNETFFFADGTQLHWPENVQASPNDRVEITDRLDLLRQYAPGDETQNGSILGGVNPQTGDRTRDGSFTSALLDHLSHANQSYTDMLGRKQEGPNSEKPLFAYIGFEFPHTPVLPPAEFRKKFQDLEYEIPELTKEELASFPPQLVKLYKNSQSDHFTDAEKRQMIVDYYAFCAYGDSLVGKAVDGFIDYSHQQGRPWMVLYVCGDHGWRLNEHGMVSKFSHYDVDLHNPIIVVSSDKQAFPEGKVVDDFTCFVDMAPTFLNAAGIDVSADEYEYLDGRDLAKTAAGEIPARDYIIAEPTWVIGPRAVIRTKDYKFAMKIRPRAGHTTTKATAGKDVQWAMDADLNEVEPTLYDLRTDPGEINNLAFDDRYRPVLDALRTKLQDIVLGDGRVEVAWTREGGDEVHTSNFAPGADDGKLSVPKVDAGSIPAGVTELNFPAMIQPVPATGVFRSKEFDIWGGSPIKGDDGKYHLFYSRWPHRLGHEAWVTHSEIAHAVAESPFGPWQHADVALPARGNTYWDGSCTHNPTVLKVDGKYYLYYMGNRGDQTVVKPLNWDHRNQQRIGVAVADSPSGPWKRFDKPVVDISADPNAIDALCVSNPAITVRPDGGVLMVYKTVAKKLKMPSGGPVGASVALADHPTGPFEKLDVQPFAVPGERFAAEDPYIWYGEDRYWAIVKDRNGHFTGIKGFTLALFQSNDGINWEPAKNLLVTAPGFTWQDGSREELVIMERPQLLFENGKPIALFCAGAKTRDKANGFNVQIPLK